MPQCLFNVRYQINDRGIEYPEKEEEITVPMGRRVDECVKKHLNLYRHAMELTTNFKVKVLKYELIGYVTN